MTENIRIAFQGIWSHKMRSFLTMLGIIIGIAAIISIVSTIKGTNEQIKNNLIGSGNNTVDVRLVYGDEEYTMEYASAPDGVPVVTDEVMEEIRAVEEVESATKINSRYWSYEVYYNSTQLEGVSIFGIDEDYFETCGYVVNKGRMFVEADYENFHKVVILDKSASQAMFQDDNPIGKAIEIKKEVYLVVGVVETAKAFEPVINSMDDYYTYMDSNSAAIFIPGVCWPISFGFDEPENLIVRAVDTDSMTAAGKKTADILNNTIYSQDESYKYRAADVLEKAKNLQELSAATNQQLLWIASISLLVGGIGVMNIMLVSVTERTREIGLKKAIGARKNKIMFQFLTEAAVLTSIGGLLGVGGGIVMAQVISRLSDTPVAISVPAIIGSVVFSMLIGIIFGLLPSYKAANLNPIDALRHE